MKYNTARIVKKGNRFECIIEHHDDIRVKRKTKPHPLGFYHYPATMPEEQATNELADALIEKRCKMIKQISHEIVKLTQLRSNIKKSSN